MTHLMSRDELLTLELERLRAEHRDLDAAIEALQSNPLADPLSLRRLKKRKLALKDQIARIEDELFPDISA
ncbi:YdcH family protein [uncultured Albimonas sp.]|uniref:YdcH family protein n=1 Tax=uncultured Albimonas sp. TaxID=1331701 RepID=UPI0030EF7E95|tara:strand:- start:9343 stop:9555 length:213 start_codon:yes stop_codon:yes gene_type:complete